jgi:hypothetical protein
VIGVNQKYQFADALTTTLMASSTSTPSNAWPTPISSTPAYGTPSQSWADSLSFFNAKADQANDDMPVVVASGTLRSIPSEWRVKTKLPHSGKAIQQHQERLDKLCTVEPTYFKKGRLDPKSTNWIIGVMERKKRCYFKSLVNAEDDRDEYNAKYQRIISGPTSLRNIAEVTLLIADIKHCEEVMALMNRKLQLADNTLAFMEVDLEESESSTSSSEDSN